ncbi:MAG TPA: hypothetical protein VFN10_09660 [Thermoanaerobaculia bacterium]|nr:hypothetical protein [Thermoanaerobaculia bacterium]
MLIGNQLAAAVRALRHAPVADPVVAAAVRDAASSDAKGFRGKNKASLSSMKTKITSANPAMPAAKVDSAAEQAMQQLDLQKARVELFMKVGLTLVMVAVAVTILWTKPDESPSTKWATGLIGTVIGYWLS